MVKRHSFSVDFNNEAEVYGPTAKANGLIADYIHASTIVITNAGTETVSIGFGTDEMSAWEGIPLAAGDGLDPGGSVVLDLKANNASTGKIRAKVHSGGTGKLSFLVL